MNLTLVEKRDEAKGTKSFFWQPEKPLNFLPGQYLYYTLPELKYPDPRGATRQFTLSSSPTESPLLRLTTRMRAESGFKKTLDELAIGTTIKAEGPSGEFIFDESEKGSHVFIAGGIGITPFRSMLKYAVDKNLNFPIFLFYSNSLPEEIAFRSELEKWAVDNSWFKLFMTVTKPEESKGKWSGQTGRIDSTLIQKLIPNLSTLNPVFWLCGPPPMVDAVEAVLKQMKVSSGQIRTDKFTGY